MSEEQSAYSASRSKQQPEAKATFCVSEPGEEPVSSLFVINLALSEIGLSNQLGG